MTVSIPTISIITTLIIGASALWAADRSRHVAEDEKIWDYLMRHRHEMVRVTEKPHHVKWVGAPLCARPNIIPHTPHGEHWIHVLVSPGGTNAIRTGKGKYPIGTMILKQKFLDEKGNQTEFFTGMRKREKGYNPIAGDWELFMLDRTGRNMIARGKIDSCVDCHTNYRNTDYVSRSYLNNQKKRSR